MRSLIAEAAREVGFDVYLAETAEEGLRIHANQPVGIVLVDWNLPGMSGLELCRALRSRADAPFVVMISARTSTADLERARAAGADVILGKPFEPEALEGELRAARDRLADG